MIQERKLIIPEVIVSVIVRKQVDKNLCLFNSDSSCYVILYWTNWSEVKWVTLKFLGIKVPFTLEWTYTEGTWLYCDYFIWCVSI